MRKYNSLYKTLYTEDTNSQSTQRSITRASYIKLSIWLKENYPGIKTILDYGSGLGLGTEVLQEYFTNVDSYDPFPSSHVPTFKTLQSINKTYDVIVCLNVLNVIPLPNRDVVVKKIFKLLNKGGIAIISTRGWIGDVDRTKSREPAGEEKAIYVIDKGKKVFQKGFDGNELASYVKSLISGRVTLLKNKFGKNTIMVEK